MAFVGNLNGPRKSRIVSKLGADYFGISMAALETDYQDFLEDEKHRIVDPVHIDKEGYPYIIFLGPNKTNFLS